MPLELEQAAAQACLCVALRLQAWRPTPPHTHRPPSQREEREQRQKLLGIEHSSASATSHLQFARTTLAETEETGVATLSEMESQGRQLRRIQSNVHEVNSLADMGRGILNNMEVTAMKNQLLLWLAILVLLGCVGAVVYFGYIKSPK